MFTQPFREDPGICKPCAGTAATLPGKWLQEAHCSESNGMVYSSRRLSPHNPLENSVNQAGPRGQLLIPKDQEGQEVWKGALHIEGSVGFC